MVGGKDFPFISRYVGKIPTMADIYSNVESLSGSVMDTLRGYGTAAQQDLEQNYRNALGMGTQALVQSGLAGTSAMPSMRMGYYRQYQRALNDLNQKIMQTKASYQTQLGGMLAQVGMGAAQAALAATTPRGGGGATTGGYRGPAVSTDRSNWDPFKDTGFFNRRGGGGYRSQPAVYYSLGGGGGGGWIEGGYETQAELNDMYGSYEWYAPESDYTSVDGGYSSSSGGGYSESISPDEWYDYDAFYGYYE